MARESNNNISIAKEGVEDHRIKNTSGKKGREGEKWKSKIEISNFGHSRWVAHGKVLIT